MATSVFQPPPTWALPVVIDEASGKAAFNPIWLRWFLDLSQNLGPSGAGSVASVTGSGNIASSGGANPNITFTGILPIANGGTNASATPTAGGIAYGTGTAYAFSLAGTSGQVLTSAGAGTPTWATPTTGTVTSVAQSFTGGLISVAGSPITSSGTLALTVAGTSGGIPYFSSATTWATSALLTNNAIMLGGGAAATPKTTTTGTGVVTALGVNVGSAGAVVVNGGALGTPSSGTVTNFTGTASININGTVGATTTAAGAFTTVTGSGTGSFGTGASLGTTPLDVHTLTGTCEVGIYANSNASATAHAQLRLYSGGASGGDPIVNWEVFGLTRYYMGIDNSNADKLVIGTGYNPGASDMLSIDTSGNVLVVGSGSLGYGTGSGGAVTQGTSRTTGVTLSKSNGAITMFSAAGSVVAATFTVTNTKVAATDTIILNQQSGTNLYVFLVTAVAAGSFNITFYTTGGVATDSPVINFSLTKGVTS